MKRLSCFGFVLFLLFSLAAASRAAPVAQEEQAGWQSLPGPSGGSVRALALSPDYAGDHTVFAGVRGEGIYRSEDGGLSWTATAAAPWALVELAISPEFGADHTLFALEGLATSGYRVHRSSDEGHSWQEVASAPAGKSLIISPDFAADETLYLLGGGSNLTYRSNDGGASFSAATGWLADHNLVDMAFSPAYAQDQTIFAAVLGEGLYRTGDGGTTWALTTLSGDVEAVAVSPNYAADGMVLALTAQGHAYRSLDGGDSWADVLAVGAGGAFTIAFSPEFAADGTVMVASTADPGPYRSTDGGASWNPAGWYNPAAATGGFVGGGVQALVLAPAVNLGASGFAGTNSALYESYDREGNNLGKNWWESYETLNHLTVRGLDLAPGRSDLMLAATSYFDQPRFDGSTLEEWNGNIQRSTDGGQTWRDVSGSLARVNAVAFSPNFAVDKTAFATAGTVGQHGFVEGGVYRSRDEGQNWEAIREGLAYSGLAFSPDFAQDQTLWVAARTATQPHGVYVSGDGGDSWQQLAAGLNVSQILPSPNFRLDHTLFAGGDALYRSTNEGGNWDQVLAGPITALAISPAYGASRTMYAARQTAGIPGALFRSEDGGNSWQEVSTGMLATREGQPITVSTLDFASDGSVLAGIHYGDVSDGASLYRSADGGISWAPLAADLKASALHTVRTLPAGSMRVYAGTGSGLRELYLPQGGPAEPGQWRSSGPRGGKGHTLAVSPAFAEDGIAFSGEWFTNYQSGGSGMGVVKSTDAGQTWYRPEPRMGDVTYGTAIRDYAVSPDFAQDDTLFVATGGGLFKSEDEGETWRWLSNAFAGWPGAYNTVAVAPDYASSQLLLASSAGSLLRSEDGGETWERNDTINSGGEIVFSPAFANDQTVFSGGGNLYRSVDRGASWQPVLMSHIVHVAISPAFADDSMLFAANGSTFYRSTDRGTTWISSTIRAEAPQIQALAVAPAFDGSAPGADTLLAGTVAGLFRSDDGGQSWQAVAAYAGESVEALAFSPGWPQHRVLLVGTADGVYRYLGATTPRQPTQGFMPLATQALAWSADANLLLAGTINHGVYGSEDGGGQWQPYGLQEGHDYDSHNNVAISPAYSSDHTLFASDLSGTSIGGSVYRSLDGGQTWERVYGLDYIGDIEISPAFADDDTVFASSGERHVVRSQQRGAEDSWIEMGTWPSDIMRGAAREIELPPNYPGDGTIFAAGSDGFWRLPEGSSSWLPAQSGIGRNMDVVDLEISPNYENDNTLLALANWGSPSDYGVFRSTDGGLNWQMVGSGVPAISLRALAFSPNYAADGMVYLLGGDDHLYRSYDGGLSWALAAAVPQAGGADLLALAANRVAIATDAGVWYYQSLAHELVVNGNFEASTGWHFPSTPYPGDYADTLFYAGEQALQVGIANEANRYAFSGAYQQVTIPNGKVATLRFHYYPVSSASTRATLDDLLARRNPDEPVAGDLQYLLVQSAGGEERLLELASNAQQWQTATFDLSPYAGQTIRLYFGAYNDGIDGRTALYVDDVSIVVFTPPAAYLPVVAGR